MPEILSIGLNEEFNPFATPYIPEEIGYVRYVSLLLPKLPPIRFRFGAFELGEFDPSRDLAPYDSIGYQISGEDFNPELRAEKIQRIKSQNPLMSWGDVPNSVALWLMALTEYNPKFYESSPISTKNGHVLPMKPGYRDLLNQLAVQLEFPNKAYESAIDTVGGFSGDLHPGQYEQGFVGNFYPLDTGPLPLPININSYSLGMHAPENRLPEIKGRIVRKLIAH